MALATSARAIIVNFLTQFGLEGLADWAWTTYMDAGGGDLGMSYVTSELPRQPTFKARFPAYDALAAAGHAMTPAEMISYERTATQMMRAAGLPPGFYDSPDDFGKLMQNEVSVAELQQRVTMAQAAVFESPPEVRDILRDQYGLDDGDLAAHWLDADRALPLLQQKFTAAEIGGAGLKVGLGITRETAEGLAQYGVTGDAATQQFGELGDQKGLFRTTIGEQMQGQQDVSADAAATAAFGLNPNARRRIEKKKQARLGEFQGTSGYAVGEGGAGGLRQVQ